MQNREKFDRKWSADAYKTALGLGREATVGPAEWQTQNKFCVVRYSISVARPNLTLVQRLCNPTGPTSPTFDAQQCHRQNW